jgi:ribosomal protein S18
MSKSTFFTGQPIFSQVLSFINRSSVDGISNQLKADRYCRHFTTYGHLVSMLYGVFNNCNSLREVTSGLSAWEHRIQHLGINYFPRRSTLSDANNRRSEEVFGKIYQFLYEKHRRYLPASRKGRSSNLYIADSTTISLFQEVMRNAGRPPANGKRKGGIKVHTLIRTDEDVPCLIRFTPASAHDSPFLKDLKLPKGSVIVFDKGYNEYAQFEKFTDQEISWVTRKRKNTVYRITEKLSISQAQQSKGVQRDRLVVLGHSHHNDHSYVRARLINYTDPTTGKKFQFLTNNTKLAPSTIAGLYQKRWQIELLFKRFKQNYPLRYFLGDSENAIKIQIWCSLIADLLLKLIKSKTSKTWSFSNLASIIRIHLMTYMNLLSFLNNPERCFPTKIQLTNQHQLLFKT